MSGAKILLVHHHLDQYSKLLLPTFEASESSIAFLMPAKIRVIPKIFSLTKIDKSCRELPGRLKRSTIGFSRRGCLMSERWPFSRMFMESILSFTHLLQLTFYTFYYIRDIPRFTISDGFNFVCSSRRRTFKYLNCCYVLACFATR